MNPVSVRQAWAFVGHRIPVRNVYERKAHGNSFDRQIGSILERILTVIGKLHCDQDYLMSRPDSPHNALEVCDGGTAVGSRVNDNTSRQFGVSEAELYGNSARSP
jgi:hypothetical protein